MRKATLRGVGVGVARTPFHSPGSLRLSHMLSVLSGHSWVCGQACGPSSPAPSGSGVPSSVPLPVHPGRWHQGCGPGRRSQVLPGGPQVPGRQQVLLGPGQTATGKPRGYSCLAAPGSPLGRPGAPTGLHPDRTSSWSPHEPRARLARPNPAFHVHGTDTCLSRTHTTLRMRVRVAQGPRVRRQRPRERRQTESDPPAFHVRVPIGHTEKRVVGQAGALQPSVTTSPPPGPPFRSPLRTHWLRPLCLGPSLRLPRAGAEPARCAPPGSQAPPPTQDPCVICLEPPGGAPLSGQGLCPTTCAGAQNKSSPVSKREGNWNLRGLSTDS